MTSFKKLLNQLAIGYCSNSIVMHKACIDKLIGIEVHLLCQSYFDQSEILSISNSNN